MEKGLHSRSSDPEQRKDEGALAVGAVRDAGNGVGADQREPGGTNVFSKHTMSHCDRDTKAIFSH